jgi:hypothetical protein
MTAKGKKMAQATKTRKKLTAEEKDSCRIVTPTFRVSYPHVFKAQAPKQNDEPKFSITMLFAKDSDLTVIKTAIKNAKLAEFGGKENWPRDLLSPVTDGDDPKHADKDGYKGHWVIKAACNQDQRPQVVDQNVEPIINQADFYAGCFARAHIYAHTWEYMGKQGIRFSLDSVQKVAEGKAFGGRKAAKDVFSPIAGAARAAIEDDSAEMEF